MRPTLAPGVTQHAPLEMDSVEHIVLRAAAKQIPASGLETPPVPQEIMLTVLQASFMTRLHRRV